MANFELRYIYLPKTWLEQEQKVGKPESNWRCSTSISCFKLQTELLGHCSEIAGGAYDKNVWLILW